MLIILEHEQRVDQASLELLHLVVQRLGEQRVVVLTTPGEPERSGTCSSCASASTATHAPAAPTVAPSSTSRRTSFAPILDCLTETEREVAQLVIGRYSSKQIATKRKTSVATARRQRAKVYEKLGVSSVEELMEQFGHMIATPLE